MKNNNINQNVSNWISRGEKLVYPERMQDWISHVQSRSANMYNGLDLDSALDIMELLENEGSIEDANDLIYSQGHSPNSYSHVCDTVTNFSKRGLEFYKVVNKNYFELDEQQLKKLAKENALYCANEQVRSKQPHDEE